MEPVPLLFIHSGADWIRGSERVLLQLLGGLDRSRFEPHLLCNRESFAAAVRHLDIPARVMPIPQIMIEGPTRRLEFAGWVAAVARLYRELRRLRPRLLFCNNGVPLQCALPAARLAGVPVLGHIHNPYNRRYIELFGLHRADRLLFVSRAIAATTTGKRPFRRPWEVVMNGLDTQRFAPPTRRDRAGAPLALPPEAVVVGQVGSLIRRKGCDLLIEAFARIAPGRPHSHLVFAGDGEERPGLEALVSDLGLHGRVHFLGDLSDPLPVYQHLLDIHVLASREEAFGMTLIEAAACGLPNVAARVNGIPEAVLEGESALLFAKGDTDGLAAALARLIDDPHLRAAFGARGRALVEERFSLERHRAEIDRVLRQMCEPGEQPLPRGGVGPAHR